MSLLAVGALAGSVAAGAFVWTGSSAASEKPIARTAFSDTFSKPDTTEAPAELSSNDGLRRIGSDLSQVRELARDLGRSHARLLIWPAKEGRVVCYALLPLEVACYPLSDPFPPLAGEHFNVSRFITQVGEHTGEQLFGVAFDDVVRLRVRIDGEWRPVSQYGNGFFVELPNVFEHWCTMGSPEPSGGTTMAPFRCERRNELLFEATLEDGTVQLHDVRTDRRVS